MKEKLRDGEINSYQWVSTKHIRADGLTKEMSMTEGMRKLLKEGKCETQRLFKTENLVCRNQNWFPLDMNVLCWQLTSTSPCQNLSQLFRQISE